MSPKVSPKVSPGVNIEPATPAHAVALALIHAEAFEPGARWGPDAMALQLSLPGAFGLIDGRGAMLLARVVADEAEILTLAVAPPARRAGLARTLMTTAMHTAALRGAKAMFLEVAAGNAPALALYAGLGFDHVGRRSGYYGPGRDALVLRAALLGTARAPGTARASHERST